MYRRIDDFTKIWKEESAATAKVFDALTDVSLSQQVSPSGRTLGKLAWHLTETLQEMPSAAGLTLDFSVDPKSVPARVAQIAAAYRQGSEEVERAVASQWTDSDLDTEVNMYGQQWAKGFVLQVLLMHQAHHRGQMTVLMRQAGLPVPGVCGPSLEEWAAMGMSPHE